MISKRIRKIASLINEHESVIDVGCDHAYLALQLRKNGNQQKIICCDNKKGPLEKSRETISKNNLENIEIVLSDGVVEVKEIMDVAVIAGMGCGSIIRILKNDPDYFRTNRLILQPNESAHLLRSWLTENSFKINAELMIKDYKYYEILSAARGSQKLNEQEQEFGPFLIREKSEVFVECYTKKLVKLHSIYQSLPQQHPDRARLKQEIKKIEAIL